MCVPCVWASVADASDGVAVDPIGHRRAVPPGAVAEAVPQHCQAEARMAGDETSIYTVDRYLRPAGWSY